MKKMLLVLKNEFIRTVTRPSYILTLILIPLVPFVIISLLGNNNGQSAEILQRVISSPTEEIKPHGYVDLAGIIQSRPPDFPPDAILAFDTEQQGKQALQDNRIDGLFIVQPDYVATGGIVYIQRSYNPVTASEYSYPLQSLLNYNLLNQDESLANKVANPMVVETVSLATEPQRDSENMLSFYVPYGVMLIYYGVILGASSLLLNSVTNEKQNRVIEILFVSVTPLQLLTGKIIALGLVGLLQTVLWTASGIGLLRLSGRTLALPDVFQLPPSLILWGVLFFILGYAIYASLMAALGALVPNLREASQATTVIILPIIIPLFFISALINDPNGTLAVILSMIPLTAPTTMMTRLSTGVVPLWQIIVSAVLQAITAVLIIRAVAGMFRAQVILSGQPFNIKRLFKALAGKAT